MSSLVVGPPPAVVPVLIGPMSALVAILPAIALAIAKALWQLLGPRGLWRTAQMIWRQKLPLAGVAAAVAGVVYAWPYIFPPKVVAAGVAEAGAWPMFRGGPHRRAFQPGPVKNPDRGKKVWSYVHGNIKDFFCAPALVGNRLYTTSVRYENFADTGAILCLNADTGGLIWAYDKSYRSTFSSPAVKGKYLVVGEGLHLTNDARVFCLDVEASARKGTGVKLWEYRTRSHVESSPCIFDDKAVVGAGDDGLYCFALEPGKDGKARVVWHLEGKDYPDCETSPIYHEGRVYWGLGNGGQAVVCVDANTGREIWKIPTPSPAFGSPAIADGKLYVGMGFGDFVFSADQVASNLRKKLQDEKKSPQEIEEAVAKIKREGEVWCINLADHKVLWKYSVGQVVLSTPAVDTSTGYIYVTSRDGKLYCLSGDGKLVRSFDFREPLVGSPAVSEDMVYVVTGSGRVTGLDKLRLRPIWNVPLNYPSISSPAVGRGHLYVGTSSRFNTAMGLVCLGLPAEPWRRTPVWPGDLGGAGKGGWDDTILPETSEYAWGFLPDPNDSEGFAKSVTSPAAHLDGDLYLGTATGVLKVRAGEDLLEKPAQQWLARSDRPVYQSPACSRTGVYFVDGNTGESGRCLRAVDPVRGAERWRRPLADGASGAMVLTWDPAATAKRWQSAVDGNATGTFDFTWDRLLIADLADGLTCLDTSDLAQPREVWKAQTGPVVGAPCLLGEELALVAVQSPPKIVAVEANSGARRWELPLASPPTTGPVVAGPRVWVGTGDGLVGTWIPNTPQEIAGSMVETTWTVACGPVRPGLSAAGSFLTCVTAGGDMLLVSTDAGAVVANLGKMVGNVPPLLTDDEVLYLTKGSIQRVDLRTGKSSLWTKITPSWPGNLLTPMIVANSHVVFATDEEGLVCMKPKK